MKKQHSPKTIHYSVWFAIGLIFAIKAPLLLFATPFIIIAYSLVQTHTQGISKEIFIVHK